MIKLLIVDDEPMIRRGLKEIIARFTFQDFSIFTASNGIEALDYYNLHKPHIIISDIRMPQMDGIELIERIRADKTHNTEIVILSGHQDFDYARSAIKFNVQEYLLKPIDRNELEQLLKKILQENDTFVLIDEYESHLNNPLITDALKYIHENYRKDITGTIVASHLNCNSSYFSQCFKKEMGINYTRYLKELRIKKAITLLRTTSMKVYEVAESVGYSSEKHFYKVFKEITNESPKKYSNRSS